MEFSSIRPHKKKMKDSLYVKRISKQYHDNSHLQLRREPNKLRNKHSRNCYGEKEATDGAGDLKRLIQALTFNVRCRAGGDIHQKHLPFGWYTSVGGNVDELNDLNEFLVIFKIS